MASDILHFAQAFFLEFRVAHRQDLVHDQNLVCAPPGSQSPAGVPATAYLSAPGASGLGHLDPPLRLRRHPRKNLEQSRFTRPIMPNEPEALPAA